MSGIFACSFLTNVTFLVFLSLFFFFLFLQKSSYSAVKPVYLAFKHPISFSLTEVKKC